MIESQVKRKPRRLTRQWLLVTLVCVLISLVVGRWLADYYKDAGWRFNSLTSDKQGNIYGVGAAGIVKLSADGQILSQISERDGYKPAVDPQGNIIVETSNCPEAYNHQCAKKYSPGGQLLATFELIHKDEPAAIIITTSDQQDNYYTLEFDVIRTPIEKYDNTGQRLETWNKDLPAQKVINLAFSRQNVAFVLVRGDTSNPPVVQKYDQNKKLLTTVYLPQLPNPFYYYADFALDAQDNLYIVQRDYLYKFNSEGQLQTKWPVKTTQRYDYDRLAVDTQGNVYVRTEEGKSNDNRDAISKIEKYDVNGRLLATFEKDGGGQFWIWWFAPAIIVLLVAAWQLVRPAKPQPLPDRAFE